jgi:AcrR family transcriptional regulator
MTDASSRGRDLRTSQPAGPSSVDTPRRRIQEAATQLFVTQGYRGTSVKDITLACSLTPGALYNHFPSKESVLYAIILKTHVQLDFELERAVEAVGDAPDERLFALVHAFALFHQQHRRETLVANLEYVELSGDDRADIVARRRHHRARFEEILTAGVASGAFVLPRGDGENDIKLVTTAIVNMAIRLSEIHGPDTHMDDDSLAAFHAELALRMVLTEARRRRGFRR